MSTRKQARSEIFFLKRSGSGFRILLPLVAIVGLAFVNAAPANAAVVQNKRMQVFVPGSGVTECISIKRVAQGQPTQRIVDAQIPTGQWQRVDAYVTVGESLTVTLYRRALDACVQYKEFVTTKVPADDKQYFWIDAGRY